jgi:hypothetical protein
MRSPRDGKAYGLCFAASGLSDRSGDLPGSALAAPCHGSERTDAGVSPTGAPWTPPAVHGARGRTIPFSGLPGIPGSDRQAGIMTCPRPTRGEPDGRYMR